ncbi:hypothetical protein C4J94_2962 [Pseudomonas sp. R5-89-07]|nr:hypothetical protein C4J94_2962 [Pseudomonas sp. R5-89-07]
MANNKTVDNYSHQCGRLSLWEKAYGINQLTNFSHAAYQRFATFA